MSVAAREFALRDSDFQFITKLIHEQAGIFMGKNKRELVYSRITRRLRELKLKSFDEYCQLLQDKEAGEAEMEHFINALTTNLTSFFREPHHFDYLEKVLLPTLVQTKSERKLRIWSAGCSSGEEAYSIAMIASEIIPRGWDLLILATELDSKILAEAETGIYPITRTNSISKSRLKKWFNRGNGQNEGQIRVKPELRSMIRFRHLNLLHPWPFKGRFDIIFCRNVVIYFDKDIQRRLFDRFADSLVEGGHLFIGHSESLFQKTDRFSLLGNTVYRKVY